MNFVYKKYAKHAVFLCLPVGGAFAGAFVGAPVVAHPSGAGSFGGAPFGPFAGFPFRPASSGSASSSASGSCADPYVPFGLAPTFSSRTWVG